VEVTIAKEASAKRTFPSYVSSINIPLQSVRFDLEELQEGSKPSVQQYRNSLKSIVVAELKVKV